MNKRNKRDRIKVELSEHRALENISKSLGNIYNKATIPARNLAQNVVTHRKIDPNNIRSGKFELPNRLIRNIATYIDFLLKIVYTKSDEIMNKAYMEGIDKKDLEKYIGINFFKQNVIQWIKEINRNVKIISGYGDSQVLDMYFYEFSKLAEGRSFVITGDNEKKLIDSEKACRIYESYLKSKMQNSIDETLILLTKLGYEVYCIRGNFLDPKKAKKTIMTALSYCALNAISSYLESITDNDRYQMRDAKFEREKWERFLKLTKLTTSKELQSIIDNIVDNSNKAIDFEAKIRISNFVIGVLYSTLYSIITGTFVYNELKGKEKIDAGEIAKALLESGKTVDISKRLVQIYELFTRIKSSETDTMSREQLKKQAGELLEQAKEIENLKSPSKPFEELTIKKGTIIPINRPWNFTIDEDITVKSGQVLYIAGDSGSGKTSLLDTITYGEPNSKGFMVVNDEDIDKLEAQAVVYGVKKTILPRGESISVKVTSKQHPTSEDEKLVKDILIDVKYDEDAKIDTTEGQSSGQEVRLLMAKVLYQIITGNKSILIVDELIGQVQEKLKKELMKTLCDCAKKYNIIVILTSHEKDMAMANADIVIKVEGSGNKQRTIKKSQQIQQPEGPEGREP